jgi:hypothetical protein
MQLTVRRRSDKARYNGGQSKVVQPRRQQRDPYVVDGIHDRTVSPVWQAMTSYRFYGESVCHQDVAALAWRDRRDLWPVTSLPKMDHEATHEYSSIGTSPSAIIGKTKMLAYHRRIVSTAEMVIRFDKPDGVRRLQFDFEDELKGIFPQPSKAIDTPLSVPPPGQIGIGQGAPLRWILNDGRKVLLASDLSLNLHFNFENGPPQQGIESVLRRHATELDRAAEKILGKSNILFAGIVLQINFVYAGLELDIHKDIAKMLINVPPGLNITTSSVAIGYRGRPKFDAINFFYNFATYKSVQVNLPVPPETQRPVDLEAIAPSEKGLQVRVDVNDRNQSRDGHLAKSDGSLNPLIPACLAACRDGLSELLREPNLG